MADIITVTPTREQIKNSRYKKLKDANSTFRVIKNKPKNEQIPTIMGDL